MKKIFSLIISAILLVTCFAFPSCATSGGILKAARVSANAGDDITIPVTYEGNPGIYVIRVTLAYDTRAVEFVSIDKTASEQFNYTVNTATEGSIVVLMDSQQLENVNGDMVLFKARFKVKSNAAAGRALFPVYCEEGMATGLKEVDGKLTPAAVSPATSTGSVTILCKEHTFDQEMTNGNVQCSACGAVKTADGEVSVDTEAGLPAVDVSSSAPEDAPSSSQQEEKPADKNIGGKNGVNAGHFIPIAAAVLIAVALGALLFVKKKKSSKND